MRSNRDHESRRKLRNWYISSWIVKRGDFIFFYDAYYLHSWLKFTKKKKKIQNVDGYHL